MYATECLFSKMAKWLYRRLPHRNGGFFKCFSLRVSSISHPLLLCKGRRKVYYNISNSSSLGTQWWHVTQWGWLCCLPCTWQRWEKRKWRARKSLCFYTCATTAHRRGEREREIWNTSSPGLYQIDNVIASSHICNTYICDEVFSEPPHVLNSYILSSMSALNILF